MHGSPLLRTLAVLTALLAAGLPLWRMTHSAAAVQVKSANAAAAQQKVRLAVAFVQKPLNFEVDYLGKPIWREEAVTSATGEKEIAMNYPKEGIDLEYKATWPAGTALTAARLSVAVDDGEAVEKTLWGSGQVDDVLTYPGSAQ